MEKILGVFARWLIVAALMVAYWPFTRAHAWAAAPAPQPFAKALYSAQFEWRGAPLLFTIGTVERSTSSLESRFVARISDGIKTVGTCQRVLAGIAPYDVNSMTLQCEGGVFGKAPVSAKFYFGPSLAQPTLIFDLGLRKHKLIALSG
jgi:hypothetical protein